MVCRGQVPAQNCWVLAFRFEGRRLMVYWKLGVLYGDIYCLPNLELLGNYILLKN